MKILWMVNVKIPMIYKIEGSDNKTNVGGWLTKISEMILKNKNVTLTVCYPSVNKSGENGVKDNFKYYGIYFDPKGLRSGTLLENDYLPKIVTILKEEKPDIIHVHGTEFQYAYFIIKAAQILHISDRVVVSIQGMVKYYAEHYCKGLPGYLKYRFTLQELYQKNNLYFGERNYLQRGEYEQLAIKNVKHIIGRTNWDRGCTQLLNPEADYHFCNETLRSDFYSDQWHYLTCEKNSIFISQASYPIKGFHLFLQALKIVKEFYPTVKVYVAGPKLTNSTWVKGSSYAVYIKKRIVKDGLQNNVVFLGPQNAKQMKENMLKANVFVSPSTIENSPNSLGEAMLLGTPCISSDVGGVSNLLIHNKEGYIYPIDEIYMLAHYIICVFENPTLAEKMGMAARKHALITHDAITNYSTLLDIYGKVAGEAHESDVLC